MSYWCPNCGLRGDLVRNPSNDVYTCSDCKGSWPEEELMDR